MPENYDLLLKNGKVVLPDGIKEINVGVVKGKIQAISDNSNISADEIFDCRGLHVLPGVIDSQVHFREPGNEHKETLESGMKSAAMGGVTAVFEMPNTNPLTITNEAIDDKLERAKKSPWTDYAFYLGGTEHYAKDLAKWENMKGVCGIKIFMGASTGDLLSASDDELEAVLSNGKRVVAIHAEDEYIMQENKKTILGNSNDVKLHGKWRSEESCLSATTRLLRIARKHNRRVHVLHITTAQEMELLAKNKDIASVEVLPIHLTLHAPECYERLGTFAQQNPPVRETHHQDALWEAVRNGTVDIIGSDHAPHTIKEKNETYPNTPSGTPAVQTMVPIMLNHVNEGRLTLDRLVELWSYGPERIHKLSTKGKIEIGYDADFTIVDLKKKKTITNEQQCSISKWTPFDGKEVTGWPISTIIRGNIVMRNDELCSTPIGEPIKFKETS
ncbi:MAG: dihydroorotase [Pseudomonadota bacterium]|nr:dihydroorotase [Pseudomonadota bacterium]MEC8996163.1 dihydroorotase [Pseudomonadota bacterium]